MNKILNFGSINIDLVYSVPHFVRAGETLAPDKVETFPGGKGLNQSIALSLAGGDVCHAGKIGADGEWLCALMNERGVNTDFVERSGSATGNALIQVDKTGQNCILLYHGANYEIDRSQIEKTLSSFGEGDLLVLQNEVNSLDIIIEEAAKRGVSIALNPSPIDEKLLSMDLSKVNYFILNEIEGEAMTGCTKPSEICRELLGKYPEARIVLTLGKDGVCYCDKEQSCAHGIYKVKAVDTTAAGDTFTGFFLSSVIGGKSVLEALRLASTASAIAVSRAGAAASVPTLEEVLAASLEYCGTPEVI